MPIRACELYVTHGISGNSETIPGSGNSQGSFREFQGNFREFHGNSGGFSRECFKDFLENCLGFLKDFPDLVMGPGHGIWQWDLAMGPGDGTWQWDPVRVSLPGPLPSIEIPR